MRIKDEFLVTYMENPRTEDGGFGILRCNLCDSNSPGLVYLYEKKNMEGLLICKGCLEYLTRFRDKCTIETIKNVDKKKEIRSET